MYYRNGEIVVTDMAGNKKYEQDYPSRLSEYNRIKSILLSLVDDFPNQTGSNLQNKTETYSNSSGGYIVLQYSDQGLRNIVTNRGSYSYSVEPYITNPSVFD